MNGKGRKKRRLSMPGGRGSFVHAGRDVKYKLDFNAPVRKMDAGRPNYTLTGRDGTLRKAPRQLAADRGNILMSARAATLTKVGGDSWYVSPTGSATGAGTISDPWTLYQAVNFGGNPANIIQAGDTVWIRGGTYTTPTTTANMQGTSITKVATRFDDYVIKSSTNPWVVGDCGKSITVYGAGTNGADLVTTIRAYNANPTLSGFIDSGTVRLTAKVMMPTNFWCRRLGTAIAPVTFCGYPGEHAIIDGNYDDAVPGNLMATITMKDTGWYQAGYQIWQNLHVKNTNPSRRTSQGGAPNDGRGDGFEITAPHCKVINCVVHDTGEGLGAWTTGAAAEIYGNLLIHNGTYSPSAEADNGAAIDLAPAASVQIARQGTPATGAEVTSPLTISYTHPVTADCVVVGVHVVDLGTGLYSNITATYNGVSMNRIHGLDSDGAKSTRPLALFVLTNGQGAPTDGAAHNVVVSYPTANKRVIGIVASFSGVHQTSPASAAGGWAPDWVVEPNGNTFLELPPFSNIVSSAQYHRVVDIAGFYGAYVYGQDMRVNGNNSLILMNSGGTSLPWAGMSDAPGAASVDMGWTWTPVIAGHGHGTYFQEARSYDRISTVAFSNTVTCNYGYAVWFPENVGDTINVERAGPGGSLLRTKIVSVAGNGQSVQIQTAPSVTIPYPTGTEAQWAPGKLYKRNIVYDHMGYCFQAYGGSGSGAINCLITENMFVKDTVFFGGLAGYRMADTRAVGNYMEAANINIGYHMNNLQNFAVQDNYVHATTGVIASSYWYDLDISGNDFIGTTNGFDGSNFPDNTYWGTGHPATNKVVVQNNAYEANRAQVFVWNWEGLANVSVDLSSVVSNGTHITIRNAQDYFGTPVWSGTYSGGTVSLPMTGLGVQETIDWNSQVGGPAPATGPGFNCFIVRATSWGW